MNKFIFRSYMAAGILYFLSVGNAGAWTITQSYDNENVGARCGGWSTTSSVVTDIMSASGSNSCMQSVLEGESGFGSWGGIISFPSELFHGDEVWIRVRTFFPNGFDYNSYSNGNRLKFLRVRTYTSSGSHIGYNDFYINPEGYNSTPFSFIYEGSPEDGARWSHVGTSADKITRGTWETYEYYIKFDRISVEGGGTGTMRVWKDGILLEDMTNRVSMRNNGDYANSLYIFTNWNGGSPQTQSMYIDDLIITNQRPLNTDNLGNPYIGMGSFVPAVAPKAPVPSVQ